LFALVAFSPFKSSHAADLLPLSQAEGGCSDGKVTSMHSLYTVIIQCLLKANIFSVFKSYIFSWNQNHDFGTVS